MRIPPIQPLDLGRYQGGYLPPEQQAIANEKSLLSYTHQYIGLQRELNELEKNGGALSFIAQVKEQLNQVFNVMIPVMKDLIEMAPQLSAFEQGMISKAKSLLERFPDGHLVPYEDSTEPNLFASALQDLLMYQGQ